MSNYLRSISHFQSVAFSDGTRKIVFYKIDLLYKRNKKKKKGKIKTNNYNFNIQFDTFN